MSCIICAILWICCFNSCWIAIEVSLGTWDPSLMKGWTTYWERIKHKSIWKATKSEFKCCNQLRTLKGPLEMKKKKWNYHGNCQRKSINFEQRKKAWGRRKANCSQMLQLENGRHCINLQLNKWIIYFIINQTVCHSNEQIESAVQTVQR